MQKAQVESYLTSKWSITAGSVPPTTTTTTVPTTTTLPPTTTNTLPPTTTTTLPPTTTVPPDTTPPTASSFGATDGGSIAGKPEAGDTITFTYSEAVAASSILASWSGSATSVTVRIIDNATRDLLEVWNSANTAALPLGTVNSQGDFTGGAGLTFSGSTMTLSGSTVTIVIGAGSGAKRDTNANAPVWSPSANVTDLAGNACSTTSWTGSAVVLF